MKSKKWLKIIAIVLLALVLVFGAIRIIFDEEFDNLRKLGEAKENFEGTDEEFDRQFEKFAEVRENYEGTDEEFDRDFQRFVEAYENFDGTEEEFDKRFQRMIDFFEQYKNDNPGATDEEAAQAFENALRTDKN